jgi:sulfite exporter TauE/SafE
MARNLSRIDAKRGDHFPLLIRTFFSGVHCRQVCGGVVPLVRTPACHAGGREFESRRAAIGAALLINQGQFLELQR